MPNDLVCCQQLSGKRDIDGRLAGAQNSLLAQEDLIRQIERDRVQMAEKIANLERYLAASENEKRQLQVCVLTDHKPACFVQLKPVLTEQNIDYCG